MLPYRIAIVSRNFGDVGGAEHFAARLAEGVADDSRYEVHVFASRTYQGHPAIRFHKLPQPWGPRFAQKPLFAWFAQRELARQGPFDLIHTHEPLSGAHIVTYGTPHEFWVRRVRHKRRLGLNDHLIIRTENKMFHHPNCRRILPMSGMVRDSLSEYYPELAEKLRVLEPGIDQNIFQDLDRENSRKELRSLHGVQEEESVALFIGNNYEHKGLTPLLEALGGIEGIAEGRKIKLWVAGRGNIARYRQMATDLGLQDRVVFAGLLQTGIERWMLAADFLVLLSSFETFGMVVLESMAAGLPTLISDQVGAKDLVVPGKNGWIIPHDSPVETIQKALLEAQVTSKQNGMSAHAKQAASRYTWEESHRKIIGIYEECLGS